MRRELPLVGLTEIAQRAGVQKPVVGMWRKRHPEFPVSVADLHTGSVFWWPEVRNWLEATGRKWDCNLSVADVNRSKVRRAEVTGNVV